MGYPRPQGPGYTVSQPTGYPSSQPTGYPGPQPTARYPGPQPTFGPPTGYPGASGPPPTNFPGQPTISYQPTGPQVTGPQQPHYPSPPSSGGVTNGNTTNGHVSNGNGVLHDSNLTVGVSPNWYAFRMEIQHSMFIQEPSSLRESSEPALPIGMSFLWFLL